MRTTSTGILTTLEADYRQNVPDLAAALGMERSAATRTCSRLVSAGLIERG